MKLSIRWLIVTAALTATAVAGAAPAQAARDVDAGGGALYVQTNDPSGNAIDVFNRSPNGSLIFVASHPTGGLGGRETGSMSDPLASQGSLRLVPAAGLLIAVNAGSNTISVFQAEGDRLELVQVLSSGGPFPTSVAVHGRLVYVLDAGGAGFVSGYRIAGGALHPIAGSIRALGLPNTTPPFFLSSPAEAGFTPSGAQLIVTTKTNGTVDVFSVRPDGRLSAAPVKNPAAGVPFAFVFDGAGRMLLNLAGPSALQLFTVDPNGTITPVSAPASDGQAALCWITVAAGFDYTSNTGSNDLSQYQTSGATVTLVDPIAASGIPGAIDSAASGGFLYVQGGLSSSVFVYSIGAGGALTPVQVASVPDGGSQEGIAIG